MEITDKGVSSLNQGIQELESLQKIDLIFEEYFVKSDWKFFIFLIVVKKLQGKRAKILAKH